MITFLNILINLNNYLIFLFIFNKNINYNKFIYLDRINYNN